MKTIKERSTLRVSKFANDWLLSADGMTLASYADQKTAIDIALAMFQEHPEKYEIVVEDEDDPKRDDQVIFSALVLLGCLFVATVIVVTALILSK